MAGFYWFEFGCAFGLVAKITIPMMRPIGAMITLNIPTAPNIVFNIRTVPNIETPAPLASAFPTTADCIAHPINNIPNTIQGPKIHKTPFAVRVIIISLNKINGMNKSRTKMHLTK